MPIDYWQLVAGARYHEQPECANYLQEKGGPEPTDDQYGEFLENMKGSRLEALKIMAEALPTED